MDKQCIFDLLVGRQPLCSQIGQSSKIFLGVNVDLVVPPKKDLRTAFWVKYVKQILWHTYTLLAGSKEPAEIAPDAWCGYLISDLSASHT